MSKSETLTAEGKHFPNGSRKRKSPNTVENQLIITIDTDEILAFNSNLQHISWGSFDSPFVADQFFHWKVTGQENKEKGSGVSEEIIDIEKNQAWSILFMSGHHSLMIETFKLQLFGIKDYSLCTPREFWNQIIKLGDDTDGAINDNGALLLGRHDETSPYQCSFKFTTTPYIYDNSFNLEYSIRFSLRDTGGHIRYCRIDPFLRTRSRTNPD